ncbi:cytidylyltransferase domain-containing protein [Flavobacterium sp.]|jgi:CMP-N,N'-diacetyllegionaminic acid synthase|uniref:acylneuraminate cytidylyltransferase family protein n=1 Tax=Flavobacterium sp. TaxID=239 RepID=UPI0022C20B50|nr:acylneuraminate cytidylyltransferase family protein [Flavobacterium sp.]MCZ8144136.1 acylneuraminate cytidylyltransferase family protein [Flavobacterium sp.]
MKPLIIIPARGGSKGVPGKNIRVLGGKPLIQHTIVAAQACFDSAVICVSTDAEDIKSLAEETGLNVPFLRPAALATDEAGSYEVILHALDFYAQQGYEADYVVLLQPTSPFRNAHHIREALTLFQEELDMVVSVKESKQNPYYNLFEESHEGWLAPSKEAHYTRRQDVPPVYEYNGAIYIMATKALRKQPLNAFQKIKKYVMNEQSSHDIDSEWDWFLAEKIWEKYGNSL